MNDIDSRDFNKLYSRPPNFCEECGDLLDFQLIFKSEVVCQRCGNKTPVETITNHLIETKDFYHNSKEWKDKLQNVEDKLKVKQELVRSTVNYILKIINFYLIK
jgi:DNA-directed RNA polymerase subunit M/transcription elongation factor TFIIS